MRRFSFVPRVILPVAGTLWLWSAMTVAAHAGQAGAGWVGLGFGPAELVSQWPAPAAGRSGFAVTFEAGMQVAPNWGIGLEYGATLPLSGCSQWGCGSRPADFAPDFEHFFLVSEFRPGNKHWRLRLGAGVMRYCYRSSANWGVDVLDGILHAMDGDNWFHDDEPSYCDDLHAFGGSVSVGYDWPSGADRPFAVGLRLGVEMAGFRANSAVDVPAFGHRAAMLTLQLSFN